MPVKIKICGITNLEDARYCAAAGADYLGFIQHAASPRYVAPEMARQIIAWVYGPAPVGVFVNEPADVVNRIAGEVGFALVQLHGDEPPEVCAAVERPVIKALRVGLADTAEDLRAQMARYAEVVDYFLLDTRKAGQWGGTGTTFDWRIARELAETFPIFLAGGIDADNVEAAVRDVRPFAVDLSSSLEERPGKKDFDKVAAFFDRFHTAMQP